MVFIFLFNYDVIITVIVLLNIFILTQFYVGFNAMSVKQIKNSEINSFLIKDRTAATYLHTAIVVGQCTFKTYSVIWLQHLPNTL